VCGLGLLAGVRTRVAGVRANLRLLAGVWIRVAGGQEMFAVPCWRSGDLPDASNVHVPDQLSSARPAKPATVTQALSMSNLDPSISHVAPNKTKHAIADGYQQLVDQRASHPCSGEC
jgi:hypothetical protein